MAHIRMNTTKKVKCTVCKVSLATLAYSCKCEKQFCINHLPAAEHTCTYNYRVDSRDQLRKQLDTSGLAVKLEKI
jgi:hypothetical protein